MNTRHPAWHPAPSVAAALVMGLLASALALLPAQAASASTLPSEILAWGSNDHAQLARCSEAGFDPDNPRCVDPAFSASPVEVPGFGDVTQLSAGLGHSLALRADGSVWAWGRNVENELGDGHSVYALQQNFNTTYNPGPPYPSVDRPEPGLVFEYAEVLEPDTEPPTSGYQYTRTFAPLSDVTAVSAGGYHSLALKDDGTVWAWGESNFGQLGTAPVLGYPVQGYTGDDASPPGAGMVPNLPRITKVAAGQTHSLALDEHGGVWAWGDNRFGQVRPRVSGYDYLEDRQDYQFVATKMPLAGKVVDIAAGSHHTLALTDDGQVWSWGNNCSGQLGSSPNAEATAFRSVPVPVSGLPAGQVVAVAAGGGIMGGHSLALTDAGEVWAWGQADVLGTGSVSDGVVTPCKDDPVFMNPTVGDGQQFWADFVFHEGRLTPARVLDSTTDQPLSDVEAIDAGLSHTLAVQSDGEVFAWGRNDVGQLGRTAGATAPAAVTALDGTVTAVSAGSHSLTLPGGSNPATTTTLPTTTTSTLPPPPPPGWEPAASMNVARTDLSTAVGADGRIYALGGMDAAGNTLNTAEVFDPCGAKRWSLIAPMPTPRKDFAAAAGPDGIIYTIGGREPDGTPLTTVEAYDPATNTWSTAAGLSVPRANLGATTGPDGLIYAVGGVTAVDQFHPLTWYTTLGSGSAMVETYDTAANFWRPVTPLPYPQAAPEVVTNPDDGRIYAISRDYGWEGRSDVIGLAQSYSPPANGIPGTWRKEYAPDTGSETLGAATTGPDGLIYAIGSSDGWSTFRTVRVYNTVTRIWTTSVEAMTSHRGGNGAAMGKDGRIYAIGGQDRQIIPPIAVPDIDLTLASTEAQQVAPSACPPGRPPADFDGDADTDVSVFRPSTGTWLVKGGLTMAYGSEGDIPVPADYDGDAENDVAVYRPSSGLWAIHRSSDGTDISVAYGSPGDIPVPADYDGDARADIATYSPASGLWQVKLSTTGADVPTTFGVAGDVPVPGDYDGDAKADLGLFRNGAWLLRPTAGGEPTTTAYGSPGDIPVPGDYDADDLTDMATFRPSDSTWRLHHSSDGAEEVFAFGAPGDIPAPGDYNADGIADPATFAPSSGLWSIETGETYTWGSSGDIPLPLPAAIRLSLPTAVLGDVAADFDADGASDVSVYRPSDGTWYVQQSSDGFRATAWGEGDDVPVPADYDGDSKTDVAVYRPSTGTWYVQQSSDGFRATVWGGGEDIPVPADYDGDAKVDVAVYRPSASTWYVQQSSDGFRATVWGQTGDVPVPADYDGDSKVDVAVYRPSTSTWYLQRSTDGFAATVWGGGEDIPVPGDYDGDSKADVAVYRPSTGTWYVQQSSDGFRATVWGQTGDVPVPADYDGDSKVDVAVYRPSTSTWYLQRSTDGFAATVWGQSGDIPLPLPAAIRLEYFTP